MLRNGVTSHQIAAFLLSAVTLPVSIVALWPLYPPYPCITIVLVYVIIYILVIYLTLKDSCYVELKIKCGNGYIRKKFIPQPDRHVIEDGRCNICDISVENGTKHCRKCNYCVPKFDHHCYWLNNCIGGRNYKLFFILVVLIFVASFASFLTAAVLIFNYFSEDKSIKMNFPAEPFQRFWLIATSIILIIYFVVMLVISNLLVLHLKLWRTGMTTYKFLLKQRRNKINVHTISNMSRQV